MRDLSTITHHPIVERITQILMAKTQNNDPMFFRLLISYYMAIIASMMRTNVAIKGRGEVPVNMYAINLATSGSGKGFSVNLIEDELIHKFKERFFNETFATVAERNIAKVALRRSIKKKTDPEDEKQTAWLEFESLGPLPFSFDSGTSAAVKQIRQKLLLSGAGSMNFIQDECASNLLSNVDLLTVYIELFDVCKLKNKLTKHTKDNVRTEEIDGRTPANMLLFGTPTKLLNGGKTEEEFYDMLETGYARRCFFGLSKHKSHNTHYTAAQVYDIFNDTSASDYLLQLADQLAILADPANFGTTLEMDKDVTLQWLEYKLHCERLAEEYSDFEEIRKAEMRHRYFKVAKLAGVYAFVDNSLSITEDHLYQAIAMAEMSGECFERILSRDRPYIKLASYITSIGREVTHADLVEDLPFYKGSEAQKREMLTLAIAYGYKNNMIIKREVIDGIEFLRGKALQPVDLNRMIVSYSTDLAKDYIGQRVPFDQLEKLFTNPQYHWANHHFMEKP